MQQMQPQNKNPFQSMLYKYGEQKLGAEAAHRSFDTDVRLAGVKNLGKRALLLAGATGFVIGSAIGLNNIMPGPSEPALAQKSAELDTQNQAANVAGNPQLFGVSEGHPVVHGVASQEPHSLGR